MSDVLSRLEAWQKADAEYRAYEVRQYVVRMHVMGEMSVAAFCCPNDMRYGREHGDAPDNTVCAGTDDRPATLVETITAALDLWERLYGEKKGDA